MTKPLVSYLRVNAREQSRSGLALEAQREAIARFVQGERFELVAEFVEVETGKGSDALERRPQLVAALAAAHLHENCPVAVSKLDRLSRDARFISRLVAQGAPFFVVELGADADPLMLPLFATLVEKQRATISQRTTAALAAAKARGAVLGHPRLAEARAIANAHHKAGADTFADTVAPTIHEVQAAGAKSLREIAAALNGRGIAAARGGNWKAQTVANVLRRAGLRKEIGEP